MKLNDPFGRMEKRHQAGYESMRDALITGKIDTHEKALRVMKLSQQRALKFLAIGLFLLLIFALIFPDFKAVMLCLAILLACFMGITNINGRRYIKQYMEKNLKQ